MSTRMLQRKGTYQQWFDSNPTLGSGEIGFETDTGKFKVGDGITLWNNLSYFISQDQITIMNQDYATESYVDTSIENSTVDLSIAAGTGIDWNVETSQFDIDSTIATKDYADESAATAISLLIDSAPEALNTLNELSSALGDDQNYASTVTLALSGKAEKLVSSNIINADTYQISSSNDLYKRIEFTSNNAVTITIPTDLVDNWPVGSFAEVMQVGDGQLSIVGASGVTLNGPDSQFKSRVKWSSLFLEKRSSNTWLVTGDSTA